MTLLVRKYQTQTNVIITLIYFIFSWKNILPDFNIECKAINQTETILPNPIKIMAGAKTNPIERRIKEYMNPTNKIAGNLNL